MDFSDVCVQKFINNRDINLLSDETFEQLLNYSASQICGESTEKSLAQIYGSKPDAVKNAFAGITSLFVEAARQHVEKEKLIVALNGSQLSKQQIEKICDTFEKNKERFQHKLETIGGGLPQLVDVNWRLDYIIKSNSTDSIGTPLYFVNLETTKHGESKFLKFTCTLQQLQELVYKLKDAVRHMEKLSG